MVKVKYAGNISPTRVNVIDMELKGLKTGDIIELDKRHADHLLLNKNFKKVGSDSKKSEEKKSEKETEEKEESAHPLDLDGDGDFDKDDVSIAGKALYHSRNIEKD